MNNNTYWYRKDHSIQTQNMVCENDGYAMNNKNRRSNHPYNSNCLQWADHHRNNFRPIQQLVCHYLQVPDYYFQKQVYQQCHFQGLNDIFHNQLIHRLLQLSMELL